MTFEGLGEMFEGDFADMCADTFLLMLMGAGAEGLACTDPKARTSISMSGNNLQEETVQVYGVTATITRVTFTVHFDHILFCG